MTPKALILIPILAIGAVFFAIIAILPFFKIYPRLGYSRWFALLMLVPLANLIFLYVVAFSEPKAPRSLSEN
jgi:hypothetical protein